MNFLLSIVLNFLMFFSTGHSANLHPVYMSVTEINHNAKEKLVEISCKIFTDDFEKQLKQTYKTKIDLLSTANHAAMDKFVKSYIEQHLAIKINGKQTTYNFLGYEQEEEGIVSYFEIPAVNQVKTIDLINNLLYEYKKEQISLMHIIVNGVRKSTKLNNPDDKVSMAF
jgi:hypothetical protein